jgi:hypothetical protein
VQFYKTCQKLAEDDTLGIILDIGPQPTMYTSMQSNGLEKKVLVATTAKKGQNQERAFLEAIALLYENSVAFDPVKLYADRGEDFTKSSLPTYPFQRQSYYPTFRMSRNSSTTQPSAVTGVEILRADQPLLDIINDHQIESRRVLPGVAFADMLARLAANPRKQVESVRFHQPWVLEAVGPTLVTQLKKDGTFTISQDGKTSEVDRLCSGSLKPSTSRYRSRPVGSSVAPQRVISTDQVYTPFSGNIHFGPAFRNVKQITMWDDHVDALIIVPPSSYPHIDRIRKLDPCLHMFGALPQFEDVPDTIKNDGFYLPTSLEGFQLYGDDLPSQFICRYHLPFHIEHNYRSVTITFEVRSMNGELLVSCQYVHLVQFCISETDSSL